MSRQLPADCFSEIFKYFENDKVTLRSCLLVNRFWCELSVKILWRNIWSFIHRSDIQLKIFNTLISCLPNESKQLLSKNGIFISTSSTWKSSLFNYASFCKVLSIHEIDQMIKRVLENHQFAITSPQSLDYNKYLLSQEILKMFMNEISSLKSLEYYSERSKNENIMFVHLSETKNCLKDLTKLKCSSDIYSEFFFQLSQICHNIQSLTIEFKDIISNGLIDLISLQNNLKNVTLKSEDKDGTEIIVSSLTKFSSSLTKLKIKGYYIPLSFIAMFTNLQELVLSLELSGFYDFNQLQYVNFPQLKVLKFLDEYPEVEVMIKFLEINGKNLNELYMHNNDKILNLIIAKFCPNLKSLFTIFMDDEIENLKLILNNCQYLESIKIWCGDYYLNEKDFLEVFAKYSPKNFYKLEIFYAYKVSLEVPSDDLENFFLSWKSRIPQKPLSLIIIDKYSDFISLKVNDENMKIIKKYMKMGIIKKFKLNDLFLSRNLGIWSMD
ncbi:unnamed protein product [Rhizophagus irregularis]|uniref:F-box domain-containing protein n=2 Tax=Rhizophagus irregularis TaxID=588596 RepID=A0A2N1MU11_9GLOM|nr:hypothetical protein RhiirC2_786599 [Rhizophagus irregularis]CAB4400635.1 unnamed protein product [Rhizophagus irregularis]CAB5387646.1 unnamed protein product [Rhizophagus irregularis]